MKTGVTLMITVPLVRAWSSSRFFLLHHTSRVSATAAAAQLWTTSSCLYSSSASTTMTTTNPLLQDWSSRPFALPPFADIEPSQFPPALETAMQAHLDDLQAIVDNHQDDSSSSLFESVVAAYDRAGHLYKRVVAVYSNLGSSLNTPEMQQVQTTMSPILSRHSSRTYTLPGLFDKIQTVYEQRHELTPEQCRLVERVHMDFVRQGAQLDAKAQTELANLKARLAALRTQFNQNVLQDESTYELVLREEDLDGCPDSLVQAAKQAAIDRGKNPNNEYVITLSRSLVEPFLMFCADRNLRHTAWEAWTKRGELDLANRANLPIATEMLKLRQRQAQLYGYKTYAEFQCADRMAQTPQAVMELLENVWERAKVSADRERQALEEYLQQSGLELEGGIQPWDWRYVAEKVRVAKYDFDEGLLKPYLSLDSVRQALFSVSENLFGLTYVPRPDLELYHPDVDAYEVRDKETDKLVAIFLHDNYSRPYKSSGAWMSEYRSQTKNLGSLDAMEGVPVVSNNNNLAKGSSGATLLSYDDARTVFHEAGHGHHGILSDATYGRLASTKVLTDFVELPSQLMEHWFAERQVLKQFARHHETGEPVPDDLLDKLQAAESFNQGFATIEYTICALMDMALHQVEDYENDFDLQAFEQKELERLGMPQGITMRHRPAHFQHLFASEMYAAGYYVYLWAEVLDADAFAAFQETGDIFDPDMAAKARQFIYSAGNTQAPDKLFRQFRGRDPDISFMLKQKGLVAT